MRRTIALLVLFALAMAAWAPAAPAANVVYPATYTGTAATGGTVELDVSADGNEIVRFALTKVPLPPCGTLTGQTPRKVAIVNDSFSNNLGLVHFSGSFPLLGQAQGSVSFHRKDGTCDSDEISWTATAPLPPPVEPPPPPPPAAPVLPPPDEVAPQTSITSGASGVSQKRKATFRFSSTEEGSTFQCKLDRRAWRACESAQAYGDLKEGRHAFRVRAIDPAGNVDSTPARRIWHVKLS